MDIEGYAAILWRRKWAILLTTVVTIAIVAIGTFRATPTYTASTTLRIWTITKGSLDYVDYDNLYSGRLMSTYAEIAGSGVVLDELAQKLNLTEVPKISAAVVPNSELLKITAQASSPALARDLANGAAAILSSFGAMADQADEGTTVEAMSRQLEQFQQDLARARLDYQTLVAQASQDAQAIAAAAKTVEVKEKAYTTLFQQYEQARFRRAVQAGVVTTVDPATTPTAPSSPRKQMNLALGLMVGLVGGAALGFMLERLDTRLFTTRKIEEVTESPILARIPAAATRQPPQLFKPTSAQADAFRRLTIRVSRQNPSPPPKTVLITSAGPREGKSTVVANLAYAIGHYTGRRVLVVDGDLRRPTLHQIFGLSNEVGLSNVVRHQATLEQAIQYSNARGICVLASGPADDAAAVLASPDLPALMASLSKIFDVVLVDSPALGVVSDAAILARATDAIALVVARNQAQREAVRTACAEVAELNSRMLGIVVTRAERAANHTYYRH